MSWRAGALKKVVILWPWPGKATSDSSRGSKNQNSPMKSYVVFQHWQQRQSWEKHCLDHQNRIWKLYFTAGAVPSAGL